MSEDSSGRYSPASGIQLTRGGIRIERKHDGRWLVVSDDYLRAWWAPDCLEWAAYTALHFARMMNLGRPELGAGVPADALERGQRLAAKLENQEPARASSG